MYALLSVGKACLEAYAFTREWGRDMIRRSGLPWPRRIGYPARYS